MNPSSSDRPPPGRVRGVSSSGAWLTMVAAGLLAFAPALEAQDTGTITGTITSARSGQPLASVQVFLPATDRGTLTSADGRFNIPNLAPGEYQLQAQRLGYRETTETVTVAAGETTTIDLELASQALRLDDIVVTGTAGQARQREVGNAITQINMGEVRDVVPSVDQLLQGRSPGLGVSQATGSVGSAAQIRLRGAVSVSQSNQPIIYIDGVRVRSEPYERNRPGVGFTGRSANVTPGPLADIDPGDIDRVEVLKGAAATTLYGTEASAGVIQIFTRRGASGDAQWTAQIDQGANRLRPFALDENPFLNMDPFLRTGHTQRYALSVSGGGESLQYFVSGSLTDNKGVLPLDREERTTVRGNFTFSPLDRLTLSWNSQYTRNDIRQTPSGNNAHGLTLNAFRAERNYFGLADPDSVGLTLNQEIDTWIDRFVTGGTAEFQASETFLHRLTVGFDQANQENRNLRPFGFRMAPEGILSDARIQNSILSVDYVTNYGYEFSPDFITTISAGAQSVTNEELMTEAYGEIFPGPGVPTVNAAGERLGFEDRLRVTNAGFFGQVMFNMRDRYFVTLGTRVDGNTAFGEDLGLQAYPKISTSYVISDEDFWPVGWGDWKLRAAWGEAGRAPGAFDAVRTWDPVGYGGLPAFFPLNVGNPDLGPERTSELELGFDASLLNDRVSTEFTYYRQTTSDALFSVRMPASIGFSLSQQENVGTIRNEGIELNVNAALYEGVNWGLDGGLNLYTNQSEVIDLGGAVPFAAGGGWVEVGQPVMAARGWRLTNPDAVGEEPQWEANHIYGPRQPTHTIGGSLALRLPGGMELSGRGEFQGGHYIFDGASNQAYQRNIRWPTCGQAVYDLIDDGQIDGLTGWQRGHCIQANYQTGSTYYPADFFKLRDITFRAPIDFAVPGANNASLSMSLRNWFRWRNDEFLMFDPEMIGRESTEQMPSIAEHIPPPAQFIASVRVTF
jgi:TonB-dependent starch-binding outer membrane protein SusC